MPTGNLDRMPQERRRLLVSTAAEEFASAGFENASLNRIIRACGLSKSSFYHVIDSKQELFDVVVRDLGAGVVAAIDIPAPEAFAGDRFWPTVGRVLDDFTLAAQRDQSFAALGRMFYLSDAPDVATSAVTKSLASIQDWLRDVLLVGRRSGAVRDDLPANLQYRMAFAILRALDQWGVDNMDALQPDELEAIMQAQFGTIRRVLAPDTTP
jgi:AcrR family transcriptional regulator